MIRRRDRRGSVLIVCLGLLGLLAVLGFSFAAMSRIERNISLNYSDVVRARMLAQSGYEAALAQLQRTAGTKSWDGLSDPWGYGIADPSQPLLVDSASGTYLGPNETGSVPLEGSRGPSFCVRQAPGGPAETIQIEGNPSGFSGELPGTYEFRGDTYSLKVVDCASKINLNSHRDPPGQSVEVQKLRNLLVNLGMAIDRWMLDAAAFYRPPYLSSPVSPFNPLPAAVVDGLLTARDALPDKRFTRLEEILPLLGAPPAGVPPELQFEILSEFVTLHGWVDTRVIVPKPQAAYASRVGPVPQDLYYPFSANGRSPVNINTAPIPVLAAVLTGLQAVVQSAGDPQNPKGNGITGGGVLTGIYSSVACTPIAFTDAYAVALAIDAYRRRHTANGIPVPFSTWEQFNAFVNGDGGSGNGGFEGVPDGQGDAAGVPASAFPVPLQAASQRGAIQAMANPNTVFHQFNPSRALSRSAVVGANMTAGVGKGDLSEYTTEFCFSSNGYFEIESLGRLTGDGGKLRAAHRIRAVVKIFEQQVITTQADFLKCRQPAGFVRTMTYPENVRNLSGVDTEDLADPAFGSALDGQISLKDRPAEAGYLWESSFDRGVEGSDGYRRANPYFGMAYKCLHSISLFNPPGTQGTLDLAGNEPRYCSDLFADGLCVGQSRNRMPAWSHSPVGPEDVPPRPAGNLYPDEGRITYWLKPVAGTGGRLAGIAAVLLPGQDLGLRSGSFYPADIYGTYMTYLWINGGHNSTVTAGTMLPTTKFNRTFVYPFSTDYFILAFPNWNVAPLSAPDWHYIDLSWSGYMSWRLLVDGRLVTQANGSMIPRPGWVTLNSTNVTDDLQIGQMFLPAYWGAVWRYRTEGTIDNPATYRQSAGSVPYRYDPTSGGSRYKGVLPLTVAAGTTSVRILSASFTQYRPQYRSDATFVPRALQPHVELVLTPGGGAISAGADGDSTDPAGLPILSTLNLSEPFELPFEVRFYDEGMTPNNVAPYLDDVTVRYTVPARSLEWLSD